MARVSSIVHSLREFTGGQHQFDVDAPSVRALLAAMDARFPGFEEHVRTTMIVAVDGELHPDAWDMPLRPDSEVVFVPLIGGG